MRKPLIIFLSFLPAFALIVVALVDSTGGTKWPGRDGHLVTSFGDASVTAPIPFQGSLWSVWAKIEGGGNGAGWQTEVELGKMEVDFVTKVGLHPDFCERGRVESVRVTVEALNNSGKENMVDGPLSRLIGQGAAIPAGPVWPREVERGSDDTPHESAFIRQ